MYKRQITLCDAGVGIGKTYAYLTACILMRKYSVLPVSYTHLDVYKRQYKSRIQGAFVCAFLESILSKMPIFLAFVVLSGFANKTITGQTCLYVGLGLAYCAGSDARPLS